VGLADEGHALIDGREVDDLPASIFFQPPAGDGARAQKHPLEVHAQHPVPLLFEHVHDRREGAHPRRVDQDVDATETSHRSIDHGRHLSGILDIQSHEEDRVAPIFQRSDDAFGSLQLDVSNDQISA
jgi:hypothetical protein